MHRFDEERLRLAHELHDTIAHTLVGINTQAAAAAHLQRGRPDESLDALNAIVHSSADALAELRSTLKAVRPAADEPPLRPTLSLGDLPELVQGVRAAGLEVDLEVDAEADGVPAATAHGAYRIVQESLTNVLRHSNAEHAFVRVALDDGHLAVEVRDDGRSAPAHATAGQGVRGMTERAAALGGRCEAAQAPDGGWRVRASLPTGASP